MVYKPYITGFGPQLGTDRMVYAKWNFAPSASKVESYNVRWYYCTGDKDAYGDIWFIGKDEKITRMQDTYTAPSNAISVRFRVLPISKLYESGKDKGKPQVQTEWSNEKIHSFSNIPKTPSIPSLTLEKYTLTATIDNVDSDIAYIKFQLFKDNSSVQITGSLNVIDQYIQHSWYVDSGSEYKVRCKSVKNGQESEWSNYSSKVLTAPSTPSGFTKCYAQTSTSVYLMWNGVKSAESYDIEYATKKEYFDSSNQTTTQTVTGGSTRYTMGDLKSGSTYFFRLRAVNSGGKSSWSGISSVVVGTKPGSPTTWSSTTTAIVGEQLILYWIHNSEDESSQSGAELEIYVNEVKEPTYKINDNTSYYAVNTSRYDEGARLRWRVRTKGVMSEYGDWSVSRMVVIYAPPTLTLSVTDSSGQPFETLTSFPINIKGTAGPSTQQAIGYHLAVTSTEAYDTVDQLGNTKFVGKGEEIYSRYFDNSDELSVSLTAGDLNLANNVRYKITCVVSMNSGLTAENYLYFNVAWSDDIKYFINGTVYIDINSYIAAIQPYCTDENDNIIEDVTLSVYRREFNGKFTEIITGFENGINVFVSDPHPSLDYARYRVVAMSKTTGYTDYYDIPAYPVGATEAVIQWDESWSTFDYSLADTLASPTWAGSMIKIPYNIDISDDVNPDVELVEYIGREHPVSYHGTQLGSTSTWSMEIPKDDKSAIYALRRLQKWMGNAYVREPSGSGYWASVKVSFSIKHRKTVVPVTLNITRVEGGI